QINLIVGDYFKSDSPVLMFSKHADDLIKWLRSKTYVLALISAVQESSSGCIMSVIRAVLTRWTTHYLAYQRLLELRPALESIVITDSMHPKLDLIKGDTKAKAKAKRMMALIKNVSFWHALARYLAVFICVQPEADLPFLLQKG
ncbi:hypothetical protein B0H10DRAFT_1807010, partial [Mycena sp. CBHHK59/15]